VDSAVSDQTATKLAASTQAHVFFDTVIVWDKARHTREGGRVWGSA
jgi:hypothetical protein